MSVLSSSSILNKSKRQYDPAISLAKVGKLKLNIIEIDFIVMESPFCGWQKKNCLVLKPWSFFQSLDSSAEIPEIHRTSLQLCTKLLEAV